MNRIYFFILILAMATACENMFEADLDNIYSEDRLLDDPSFAEGLLLKAYTALPNNSFNYEEMATDDAVSNRKGNDFTRIANGEWSALFNPLENWTNAYNNIGYLNKFLSVVDRVAWSWESEYRDSLFTQRYTGEALALRAWYHFNVLMYHGGPSYSGQMSGIPYITEEMISGNSTGWNLPRPSYQATTESILSDLNKAFLLLPLEYKDVTSNSDYNRVNGKLNQGRVSGLVVKAMIARIALYAASPAFNDGEYNTTLLEKACEASAYLINAAGGVNEMDTRGDFKDGYFWDFDNDKSNKDVLWRSNFFSTNLPEYDHLLPSKFGNGELNPSDNFVKAFPSVNGFPIDDPASNYDSQNPYANRDPRLNNIVFFNGAKYSNSVNEIVNIANGPLDGIGKQVNSTLTGYYLRKTLRVDVSLNPSSTTEKQHIRPFFRYTEMFLIYAEAANELYGPTGSFPNAGFTAKQAILNIRKRAKIVTDNYANAISSKEEMRELIRNERRIELCFEGFRFWDIRRWNMPLDVPVYGITFINNQDGSYQYGPSVIVEGRNFQPHMRFGPIPESELLKSSLLEQNMGW